MKPKTTIAIPNYNYGRYLAAAIESALAQSCTDFELLISDNASTDDSLAIIDGYCDRRIRVMPQRENRGLYFNWNLCLREARGEYFKLLQADDVLLPRCLEIGVEALENSQANLCLMSYCRMDEDGKDIPGQTVSTKLNGALSRDEVIQEIKRFTDFVPSSGNMVRTAAAQAWGYGGKQNFCGDLMLWAHLVETGRVCSVAPVLSKERVHSSQARRHGRPVEILNDYFTTIDLLSAATRDGAARAALRAWEEDISGGAVRASLGLVARGRINEALRIARAIARQGRALPAVQGVFGRAWRGLRGQARRWRDGVGSRSSRGGRE